MTKDNFDSIIDKISMAIRYYKLAAEMNIHGYISPSLGIKVDDLKKIGKIAFGDVAYDKRDKSISKKWRYGNGVVSAIAVMKKGSRCELLLHYKDENTFYGSNIPDLSYESIRRINKNFTPDPPYPRLQCANTGDLEKCLLWFSGIIYEIFGVK